MNRVLFLQNVKSIGQVQMWGKMVQVEEVASTGPSDGTETSVFKEENEDPYDELRVNTGERPGGGEPRSHKTLKVRCLDFILGKVERYWHI